MEEEKLASTIGKNIMRLRKMMNMTQLELAELLGYSDKSISKWEQGNGIPDVRTLVQLSEFFNVSVDDIIGEHEEKPIMPKRKLLIKRLTVMICSVLLCWLVAVVAFAFGGMIVPSLLPHLWLAFVYAVPVSSIVVLVFSCLWHYRWVRIVSLSVLIWTTLACAYLTVYVAVGPYDTLWLIFLIGVPLQLLTLFFFLWQKHGTEK